MVGRLKMKVKTLHLELFVRGILSLLVLLGVSVFAGCQTTGVQMSSPEYWRGPIIDAHSQVDRDTDSENVIPLMDRAGVSTTILSTRFERPVEDILAYANRHAERIVPALKIKTGAYMRGDRGFQEMVTAQLTGTKFGAMPEVIMWHEAKGTVAGKAVIAPDDPRVAFLVDIAKQNGWPFIAHIEFAGAGVNAPDFMKKLEALLRAYPDLPVGLIHMGQLQDPEVARLIGAHPNVFFLTSHANPITLRLDKQPWSNMFEAAGLAPDWERLVLAHPDRFVLAFDNVFPMHWGSPYLETVALWRRALKRLPEKVAHQIAHGNAERLWRLPPAESVRGFPP